MDLNAKLSSNQNLPVVLVSAADLKNCYDIISEIINSNIINDSEDIADKRIVWQIVNKYYHVDVEMYPIADDSSPPEALAERIEAHIIYISETEEGAEGAEGAMLAEQRRARGGAAARAPVRLLALQGGVAPRALAAWARRRRYEPVPLRAAPAPADEPAGAERARAALHAHTWRGLRRVDGRADDEAGAVERAELFAEALGALGEAGAGGAGGAGAGEGLARDERLRRAERLVAAFCRALGADLPAL